VHGLPGAAFDFVNADKCNVSTVIHGVCAQASDALSRWPIDISHCRNGGRSTMPYRSDSGGIGLFPMAA
jgi:hypothetical protein